MAPSNTWTETDPTGSSFRSLGDDAIRQFKLDLRERLASEHVSGDGTVIEAADFTEARHKLSSIGLLGLLKGLRIEQRTYGTSGNITISGRLQIEINGDMCYLNSDTNLAFSGLAASTSYYIYVASPGHETEIVAGNLSYSTTVPTYSTAKKGWYSGTSRAIGFFRAMSTGGMLPFIQSSNSYRYLDSGRTGAIFSLTPTTVYLEHSSIANNLPVFISEVLLSVYISITSADIDTQIYFSCNGTTHDSRILLKTASAILELMVQIQTPVSATRTIYYKMDNATTSNDTITIIGFDLDGSL